MNKELNEKVLTPQPLLYGHKITVELCNIPYNDTILNDDYTNIRKAHQILLATLNHFWEGYQRELLVGVREHQCCNTK